MKKIVFKMSSNLVMFHLAMLTANIKLFTELMSYELKSTPGQWTQ